jgi:hypothetical protein
VTWEIKTGKSELEIAREREKAVESKGKGV